MSDFAIHLTADIIGEADPFLPMTVLRTAARGGREAIIDKSGPLAKLAAKRCDFTRRRQSNQIQIFTLHSATHENGDSRPTFQTYAINSCAS
jgi:hypothetical protein